MKLNLAFTITALSIAACSNAWASDPDPKQIADACAAMAAATDLHYYINYIIAYSNEQPRFEALSGVKIATAKEGGVAKVIATCTVKYHGRSGVVVNGTSRNGFDLWIRQPNKEIFQDNAVEKFKVNFIFRQYDTGWLLEGHE
jgi:hypothetical protein